MLAAHVLTEAEGVAGFCSGDHGVDAHEHRDLELVTDPELVKREGNEDSTVVDAEDPANAILCTDAHVFISLLERIVVGLADATEGAGDGLCTTEVRIGAVRAARGMSGRAARR
jgi:hypothetical protein